MNLDKFFNAKKIAIIGVSTNPNKVGHVIFKNFIDSDFNGEVFPINPKTEYILGHKSYKSVLNIKTNLELAVIAVPAELVLKVVDECGRKGIRNIIVITAGFRELGNYKLEDKLFNLMKKYNIKCIGVNCLGVFDAYTKVDTLFLPKHRLKRPKEGGISFICQSGAVASAILDLASKRDYKFAKFVSYGNATNVDESDILDYMGRDEKTRVICMYIEGVKDGSKFLKVAKEVSKKKPIIVVKGGISEEGHKATLSHTGSLAGNVEIYEGVFKQANIIYAESLEEMFDFTKIFDKAIKPKGRRVLIVTNGGGYGIISTDSVIKNELKMSELSNNIKTSLRKRLPKLVNIRNPLDLIGDANTERYKIAIEAGLEDNNVDILLVVLLYQTPLITTDVVEVVSEFNDLKKKPIIIISTGGDFTEVLMENLEENNVPCYVFPENGIKSIKKLVDYYKV